jgi:hypothetical protein
MIVGIPYFYDLNQNRPDGRLLLHRTFQTRYRTRDKLADLLKEKFCKRSINQTKKNKENGNMR